MPGLLRGVFLGLLASTLLSATANAAIITLDASTPYRLEPKCCGYIYPWRVIVDGFEFEGRDVNPFPVASFTSASAFTMDIFRLDGALFRPISADVSWIFRGVGDAATPYFLAGGQRLDFAPAGVPFGGSGVMTFPDDLWVSSMSLSILPIGLEEVVTIRSLTVETIPEPPSAWLMALGLASLPLMRRRLLARQSRASAPRSN